MPSAHDHRDQKDAARLLLAAAVALIVLLRSSGAEFTTSWNMQISRTRSRKGSASRTPRSSRWASRSSWSSSWPSCLAAIFGELPFTIAGFLIFFVIFWLMIAWIF